MNLEDIFDNFESKNKCNGCSILRKRKPRHTILDYIKMEELDVLFLSDSVKWNNGDPKAFRPEEEEVIIECIQPMYEHISKGLRVDFASAVKCPNVVEADMETEDRKICKTHLNDTMEKLRPKLVYACGNLAMRMLVGKSGIAGKRGKTFTYTFKDGTDCWVVPIYHPFAVVQEPKNRYLFEVDIRNGYRKHILGIHKTDFSYVGISNLDELHKYDYLYTYSGAIAVDLETTGLDFNRDTIHSVSFGFRDNEGNIINTGIPWNHRHSPFKGDEKEEVVRWIHKVFQNPNATWVFQNGSFDRKFMMIEGIRVTNCFDTKVLGKLITEDSPNDLKSMVREYFADELEKL